MGEGTWGQLTLVNVEQKFTWLEVFGSRWSGGGVLLWGGTVNLHSVPVTVLLRFWSVVDTWLSYLGMNLNGQASGLRRGRSFQRWANLRCFQCAWTIEPLRVIFAMKFWGEGIEKRIPSSPEKRQEQESSWNRMKLNKVVHHSPPLLEKKGACHVLLVVSLSQC